MVYHVAPITIVGRPNPASQKVSYFKREKNMTVTTKDKPISVKTIFAAGAILIVGLGLGKTLVSINETLGQVSDSYDCVSALRSLLALRTCRFEP